MSNMLFCYAFSVCNSRCQLVTGVSFLIFWRLSQNRVLQRKFYKIQNILLEFCQVVYFFACVSLSLFVIYSTPMDSLSLLQLRNSTCTVRHNNSAQLNRRFLLQF